MAAKSPYISGLVAFVGAIGLVGAGCAATDEAEESAAEYGTPGLHMNVELGDRTYDLYAPEGYDGETPVPAVLVLHGMPAGPAEAQYASGMDDLADEEGFLAVYPAGTNDRWTSSPGGGDATFLNDLVEELVTGWNADPDRVYVSGFSNGADMAMVFAIERPDLVAAVAPVTPSGTGRVERTIEDMTEPVPMVAFLGGIDQRLSIGERLLETWRAGAGCDGEDTVEAEGLTTSTWECDAGTTVEVHVVDDGAHQWFGDANRREPLWASEAMWEFFTEHAG